MTNCKRKQEDPTIYQLIEQLKQHPDNEKIKEKIVIHYTQLVYSLARRFAKDATNREDLIQVGMIGLINASLRYDNSYGTSFEAFAIPTIIGEIKRYIRDKTWSVQVPRKVKELSSKIQQAIDDLMIELQRTPTLDEIAKHLDISVSELAEAILMNNNYKSLSVDFKYHNNSDDNNYSLSDIIGADETYFAQIETKMLLESVFKALNEREQKILKYVYFDRLTQREVGEILGISQMHVSRLQKEALLKLRKQLEKIEENL